jgi:hypothetical protein
MQKCPRCGYDEGVDWPEKLIYLAFAILWVGFAFPDHVSRRLELLRIVAMALWLAGVIWKSSRYKKLQREHEKLHQAGLKDHLKASPSQ